MGQVRLNGLAMLYYHHSVDITPEEVVDEFARCHPTHVVSQPISRLGTSCAILLCGYTIHIVYDLKFFLHIFFILNRKL